MLPCSSGPYRCRLAEEAGSASGFENEAALVFPEQH